MNYDATTNLHGITDYTSINYNQGGVMMKKLFDEDLSLSDLKAMIGRLHKKKNHNYVLLGVLGALLLVAIIALIVIKLRCCCCDDEFDDFDYDDEEDEDEVDDDVDFENEAEHFEE